MPSIAAVKAEIKQLISVIQSRMDVLGSALASLKETLHRLDALPPDIGEATFAPSPTPPRLLHRPPNRVLSEETVRRLRRKYGGRDTQYDKIARFFVTRKNTAATVAQIATAIDASRSATTNILYRTQKEAFISQRVEGEVRLRSWTLRPDAYQRALMLAQNQSERGTDSDA